MVTFCILILASHSGLAEENIAYQIWEAMAAEGGIDLSTGWEYMGIYTFGEMTGDGYVTLPMAADNQHIVQSASWRIYPDSCEEITNHYIPMLWVLMNYLLIDEDQTELEEWLQNREAEAVRAKENDVFWLSETAQFTNIEIHLQFDNEHNELYCLLVALIDSPNFVLQ